LPVVATRSGGVPDAVVDGETGLLCEEGDVDGIAAAILRLLGDEELARRMGLANRDWAETLTWERTIEEQLKLYEEVL
jgi:glycosyltransferase involved in cell wall biosynthesis